MNITSAKLIYFSPTHTTKRVLERIAQGIQVAAVEHLDLTPPGSLTGKTGEITADLVLIGVPVYGGRVPVDAISRLQRLRGKDTPAVIVVVYGNRAYEDALVELRDLAVNMGFRPIAAAAFIGEHSYSNNASPVAVGRPDTEDLRKAEEFGRNIRGEFVNMQRPGAIPTLQVPGNIPYKERSLLQGIAPVTSETVCAKCGTCASLCPTAAIIIGDTVTTAASACIRCCACIKNCPTGARVMEDQRVQKLAEWLTTNCGTRKEPETYI